MELDLGCREDVEVRECFSSPEILKLKAHCELARYHVAAPNRLHCPFGLAGPVFEVVARHLCRRRDCVLEVQILCAQCHGCQKNTNHSFHPGSAHACFLWMRRTFRVPFLTLPFGLGIIVKQP